MTTFIRLYFNFFITGLFAMGGGMSTIPFLYDMSDRTGWFTYSQLADMIAVSECTPGAIGANMASYVGFSLAGVPGAVIATLGIISPSIIIILIIAKFLTKYHNNRHVQNAFDGLKPASFALIAIAAITMIRITLVHLEDLGGPGLKSILNIFDIKAILLAAAIFIISNIFKKLHPVALIAMSALAGIVFSFAE